MRKTLKYAGIAIAALIVLLAAGAAILAATFDPNDYKPQLIRLVQEKKQRTLVIPGAIRLSLFPKLGADLGKLSISEHKGSAEFASVEHAQISLALIPLLSRQLVVDQVRIDGLRATLRRNRDGSTNVDDLLAKDEAGAQAGTQAGTQTGTQAGDGRQLRFDIDGIRLSDARVVLDDRQQGRMLELSGLELETGRIADRAQSRLRLAVRVKGSRPDINASVAAKTGFRFDLGEKSYRFDGLDAEVKGILAGFQDLALKLAGDADLKPEAKRFVINNVSLNASGKHGGDAIKASAAIPSLALTDAKVSGGRVAGEFTLVSGARNLSARFDAPAFEGTPQAFRIPALTLDAALREDKLDAKLKVTGALNGDIDRQRFASPQLRLALSGSQGGVALGGTLTTPFSADLQAQQVELPRIAADFNLPNPAGGALKLSANGPVHIRLDRKTIAAQLAGRLDQSAFDARLGMNGFSAPLYTFDVGIDRLDLDRYRSKPAQAKPGAAQPSAPPAQQPADFSALQKLQAKGSLRIGALKAANIRAANVRADLRAAGGKLELAPLAASLYGGNLSGALALTASKPALIAVRQTLTGIDVGPLLKDAIGKDPVEGRGNVQLDVTARGADVEQWMKALNGSARLALRDGAVRGINVAQAVREAKARLGQLRGDEKPQAGTASAAEKTDFSELDGSFRIVNGVAHNDDLVIKSPLIRVSGAGDVDLGAQRLDYVARTTVVSSLQGQGGPELQALKGVTLPVRLSGPFTAIGWRIDFAGMATELAKRKLDERKDEVKEKAQKALGEEKEKIRGQLKDQLKGLFGK